MGLFKPSSQQRWLALPLSLLMSVFLMGALAAPANAQSVDGADTSAKVKKSKRKTVKRPAESSPFLYGSNETQKARDKRLSRECKGAANGGACRGYTQ